MNDAVRTPLISVVMAFRNEERCLARAIRSVQAQTFQDWELILIDDGSTDASLAIARDIAAADSRIRTISCGINIGLPAALNIGIFVAVCDLIARADGDDINLADRFQLQYDFMAAHPEVDIVGTAAYLLGEDGKRAGMKKLPHAHDDLVRLPFDQSIFFHPSVLIRKRFFDKAGVYDVKALRAQDKDLWLRGIHAGARYANLQQPLIEYSTRGFQRSWSSVFKQIRTTWSLVRRYRVRGGYLIIAKNIARLLAIKLGMYRSASLKSPQ